MTPNSMGRIPLHSVSTFSAMNLDVSEPTLEHFDPPIPTVSNAKAARVSMPSKPYQGDNYGLKDSNSTSSYDYGKKWSDSTDAAKTQNRNTDDENPSSSDDEGKNQVDDIVAAALAYAEKSHCEDGVRSYSNSTVSQARKGSAFNESIHSFYSRSDGPSLGEPSEGVDDMVARVLSEAGDAAQKKRSIATLAGQTKLLPPRSHRSSMESSMYSQYSEESGPSLMLDGQFNC
jgi:hypothetical protein